MALNTETLEARIMCTSTDECPSVEEIKLALAGLELGDKVSVMVTERLIGNRAGELWLVVGGEQDAWADVLVAVGQVARRLTGASVFNELSFDMKA